MNATIRQELFDTVLDRKASNSMKWAFSEALLKPDEAAANPLPMWVADMDFRAPQPVIDALREAVEDGVSAIRAARRRATSRP